MGIHNSRGNVGVPNHNKNKIKFSSFTLTFRIEAVAHAELMWPTTCIENYNEEGNEVALLTLQQNEVEEKRERVIKQEEKYKRRVTQYHNKRVMMKN